MSRYSIALEEQLKLARELREIGKRTGVNHPTGGSTFSKSPAFHTKVSARAGSVDLNSSRLGPGWRVDNDEARPSTADDIPPSDRELYDSLGGVVELATPFFVSVEMTKVILSAMSSLPDDTSLKETDFAAQAGFIWLDEPVPLSPITPGGYQHLVRAIVFSPAAMGGMEMISFGYSTQPGKDAMKVKVRNRTYVIDDFSGLTRLGWQLWAPGDTVGDNEENKHLSREFLDAHVDRPYVYTYVDAEPPHYKSIDVDPNEYVKQIDRLEYELRRLAAAVVHFMSQRVVSLTRREADRATRRRIPEWKDPEVVQVELLRRHHYPNRDAEGGGDKESVEWSCRWIVSAHWRNQWYPAENRHKPKWIMPYVKGPDGKPIKGNTKIFAVVR